MNPSIPPDFPRRVRENPQIAIDLLESLDSFIACESGGVNWDEPRVVNARIAAARARGNFSEVARITQGHYTELAREAAERNGEEILREHLA
jgi:hypothetical protein